VYGRARVPRVLPSSSFNDEQAFGFAPSPLDALSLYNGVAKFEHPQCFGSHAEALFALEVLEAVFPFLEHHTQLAEDSVVLELLEDKKHKAAGDPWRIQGAHSKGEALRKFGLSQLEEFYRGDTSVIGSTLKDELRPIGKDARLFRPQDVSSYIEGARLFHSQNMYLTETHRSPVFCRFVVPGQDVVQMFCSLRRHGGENFAADGAQWDAHFPLFVASILAEFRISGGLPRDRVERYYQQMYSGYTLVFDELLNLPGQPSGHFNTSVDNSLCHIVLMAIHAFRHHFSLEQFLREVKYYSCGDDLVWSTRSPLFRPVELEKTYNSLCVYLEFQSFDSLPVEELVFVGVKLTKRTFGGREFELFTLVSPRSFASLHIHKRKTIRSPLLKLAKFASLAILWFCDVDRYKLARNMFEQELAHCVRKGSLSPADPVVVGLWGATQERRLLHQYLGWEFKQHEEFSVSLSFGPSWNSRGGLSESCRRLCGMSSELGTPCSVLLRRERIGV